MRMGAQSSSSCITAFWISSAAVRFDGAFRRPAFSAASGLLGKPQELVAQVQERAHHHRVLERSQPIAILVGHAPLLWATQLVADRA